MKEDGNFDYNDAVDIEDFSLMVEHWQEGCGLMLL